MVVTFIALGLFGLAVVAISVWGWRVSAKSAEDFMLAGRGIGIIVMFFFTLFGISSAWTFYGYPGFLYRHGPFFVYFVWGCIAGFIGLYMFLGPRLWAVSKLNHFLSPVETLAARFESKTLRLVLSVILLGSLVPYIAIEPRGVGIGFAALAGLAPQLGANIGIGFTVLLLIIIVLLGGMRSTAWANILLGLVYTITFLGALVWVVKLLFPGGLPEAVRLIMTKRPDFFAAPGPAVAGEPLMEPLIIGGYFIAGFMAFSWPHIVVGNLTARGKAIFKWMPLLGIVAGGLGFYAIPFIWGSIVAPAVSQLPGTLVPLVTGKAADNVVQVIVARYLPSWVSTFVLMGVVAAAVSTASVQLLLSAIVVARDVIHGLVKPDLADKKLVVWTKVSVLALLFVALLISLWNPMALALYLTDIAVPGFAQWAPVLAGGLLWKRATRQGALAGTIAGSVYLIAAFIWHPLRFNMPSPLVPALALNLVLFIVVSLLTPRPSEVIQRQFFDEVDDFLAIKER